MSADTEYPETRDVFIIRDATADDEEVERFHDDIRATNFLCRRDTERQEDLWVDEQTVSACQGCGDTRPPLHEGRCFFCHDANEDAVEALDEKFREVAADHSFAVAFWSLNKVYDRYDGLDHDAVAEVPDR